MQRYEDSTRRNIITLNGRRALLSSWTYPGTFIRDALFWGPLALGDPALGWECYQWFAESQLDSGQIRTAVPITPADEHALEPKDDEGSLLFVIASDWLRRNGFQPDFGRVIRAWEWANTHVQDHRYWSSPGPFRYWADTVSPDRRETIAYNQGLLCLARRAMLNMGLGVTEDDARAAQAGYRAFYDSARRYVRLGRQSQFASAQDVSAIFPEFISRVLNNEPILADAMIANHVARITRNAAVFFPDGRIAGLKILSSSSGAFLPPKWFHVPGLHWPGNYVNGAHWPPYTLVALALAYAVTREPRYAEYIAQLVEYELNLDGQSKEFLRLTPGAVGAFDPERNNYTGNILVRLACRWCGLA